MTIVACFTLAILLYSILGFRQSTHPLIYVTAGLLLAMGAWQIQTLWRIRMLAKHLKKNKRPKDTPLEVEGREAFAANQLEAADFENIVPVSVTEHTIRHLSDAKFPASTKSEH